MTSVETGASTGSVVATTLLLVVAWIAVVVVTVALFFLLAFTDYCPEETCSVDGAATSVLTGIGVALAAALIGTIVSIVRAVRHRPSWPWAAATLVVVALAGVGGSVGYFVSVGG